MTFLPRLPIVAAPMGGGPSTPRLVAAVSDAGGIGFLAAAYKTPDAVRDELAATRELTGAPVGINVFAPVPGPGDPEAVRAYAERLRPEAERLGVALGEPRFDDDAFADKVALLEELAPAVVSFAFGCPKRAVVAALQGTGSAVWVTVTDLGEAEQAAAAGADALVVQGVEAGAHRGSFTDDAGDFALLALLQLVRARVPELPLVATGGIATGAGVAAALAAGACAAQLGTAFLCCPEAGTAPAHRDALATSALTRITRAFTGRQARGIVNDFLDAHHAEAPSAYPEVHHLTAPLRAAARQGGDAAALHLWAGQAHELVRELPAAELVAELVRDAAVALDGARAALRGGSHLDVPPQQGDPI